MGCSYQDGWDDPADAHLIRIGRFHPTIFPTHRTFIFLLNLFSGGRLYNGLSSGGVFFILEVDMTQSIESMIEVLQAYQAGKKIEIRDNTNAEWRTCLSLLFNFSSCEYRIAPEPKKKVKLEAWLLPSGALVWYDMSKVNTWSTDCIRVPSEDKEIYCD